MSSPILRATIFMSGAILSFSTMAIMGRMVSGDLDTFEIMLYRSLVGLAVIAGFVAWKNAWSDMKTQRIGVHAVRNLSHFAGQNLWFFAVTVAPLAQVFALEFTSPIWVLILAPLVLGEKLTRVRIFAGICGFIGVLIVTRPLSQEISVGAITAALSAIGFAGSILFTKKLTKTEPTLRILFYLTAMQAVFGLICAGYDLDITLPSMRTILPVVTIGCAGLLAHYCLTSALSEAPATVVIPMDFVRLPAIAVVGYAFYYETLDIYVFLGALIIFFGNYINIWTETRR